MLFIHNPHFAFYFYQTHGYTTLELGRVGISPSGQSGFTTYKFFSVTNVLVRGLILAIYVYIYSRFLLLNMYVDYTNIIKKIILITVDIL